MEQIIPIQRVVEYVVSRVASLQYFHGTIHSLFLGPVELSLQYFHGTTYTGRTVCDILQHFHGTIFVRISIGNINKFAGINMQLMARDEPLLPFKEVRKLGPSSAFSGYSPSVG